MIKSNWEKFIHYYLPAIIWAGVIFCFSSQGNLKIGASQIGWEVVLRKLAHIFEYAIMGWLFWRIFFYARSHRLFGSLLLAQLLVFLYALSDEAHQFFVAGRAGKAVDVLIDVLGASLALTLISMIYQKKYRWIKGLLIIIVSLSLVFIGAELVFQAEKIEKNETSDPQTANSMEKPVDDKEAFLEDGKNMNGKNGSEMIEESSKNDSQRLIKAIPKSYKFDVPFTSQAPFANWDEVHEEACEEASLIMIKYYLSKKPLDKEAAEEEIQKMKEFQIERYGDYKDSDMQQLARLAKDFYGIDNLKVVYDFSKGELEKLVYEGGPVIIPTAGRKLGNPNFTSPGPLYHNLVITGFEGDKIITNDPGTRRGKDYEYNIDVLYEAIHDFTGKKEDIEKGKKALIMFK